MRNSTGSLSLNNSNTIVADYIYLLRDGALSNLNDLLQTSTGLVESNLTDNSINSIVLTSISYSTIADPRITLDLNDVIYNSSIISHI